MRKILSFILFVVLAVSFALPACASDIEAMSPEELKQLQREIALQLCPEAEKGTVLFDNEYAKMSYLSIEDSGFGTEIKVIVENKTDKSIAVSCNMMSINKWTVFAAGPGEVAPSSNLKGEISIYEDLTEYGINSVDDITTISFDFHVLDNSTYDRLWSSDMIDLAL